MAKLIVTLDGHELRECAIGTHAVSIGRLADNQIVIDNPTVSGRHARVYRDGPHFVLEDLKSTNGTFVNENPVARHSLLEGDVVIIGKHALLFTLEGGEQQDETDAAPFVPAVDDTVPVYGGVLLKTAIPTAPDRIGTVRIIGGSTGQSEYTLAAMTTVIGKANTAQIRLKGWFKPQMAATIVRSGDTFTVSPIDGKVDVNGERVSNRRELSNGDVIAVSGLTLEFRLS